MLVLVCALFVCVYIFDSKSIRQADTLRLQQDTKEVLLSAQIIEETEETRRSTVKISIPEIVGLKPDIINTTINESIKEFARKTKADFMSEAEGFETVLPDQKHQLIISGSLVQQPILSNGILGVDIEVYTFYSGAAHPSSYRKVFNFIAQTGQSIRIEDILKPNVKDKKIISAKDSDYLTALTQLSNIVRPKIIQKMNKMIADNSSNDEAHSETPKAEDSFFSEGIEPKLENFDTFFIRQDGIEFVFSQYQVAPYSFGEISVHVPWSEMEGVLLNRSYLQN